MRNTLLLFVLCVVGCDSFLRQNPQYCEDDTGCEAGAYCDLSRHGCLPQDLALTSVSPTSVTLAGGGRVRLYGQAFDSDSTVTIDGTSVPTTFISATELEVVVPAAQSCGLTSIVVQSGYQQVKRADLLRYRVSKLTFFGQTTIPVDSDAIWAAPAPLNGDSATDLLVGHQNTPSLRHLINSGSDTFTPSMRYAAQGTYGTASVIDMNGDGTKEIVVRGPTRLDIFRISDGAQLAMLPLAFRDHTISDVNQDGVLDIVAINSTGMQLLIYFGTTSFGYANPLTVSLSAPAQLIGKIDLNGDGLDDFALLTPSTSSLALCFGVGRASLSCAANYVLEGVPTYAVTANIDGTGSKSLIVLEQRASTSSLTAVRMASGVLGSVHLFDLPMSPVYLLVRDLDCDGLDEIASLHTLGGFLNIYMNNGGSYETTPTLLTINSGATPASINIQGFKSNPTDLLPDLITTTTYNGGGASKVTLIKNISE